MNIGGNLEAALQVCNGLVSMCWAFYIFCAFTEPSDEKYRSKIVICVLLMEQTAKKQLIGATTA